MNANEQSRDIQTPPGWHEALPRKLAPPTYWPAMLALGMTLTLLGPVTAMAISVVGVLLAAVALAGWIGEIERA